MRFHDSGLYAKTQTAHWPKVLAATVSIVALVALAGCGNDNPPPTVVNTPAPVVVSPAPKTTTVIVPGPSTPGPAGAPGPAGPAGAPGAPGAPAAPASGSSDTKSSGSSSTTGQ